MKNAAEKTSNIHKEKEIKELTREFRNIPEKYRAYLFPYFNGDISLVQLYATIPEKVKERKLFGLINRNRRKNIEEIKNDQIKGFEYNPQTRYLNFLQEHTESAWAYNSNCIVSLHPRILKYIFKSSSRTIIGNSSDVQNFILNPS